jgi:hypothetical protein
MHRTRGESSGVAVIAKFYRLVHKCGRYCVVFSLILGFTVEFAPKSLHSSVGLHNRVLPLPDRSDYWSRRSLFGRANFAFAERDGGDLIPDM